MNMSSLLLICYFNYKYANLYITYDKYLKETSICTFTYCFTQTLESAIRYNRCCPSRQTQETTTIWKHYYILKTPLPYFSDLYLHSISLYMYILRSSPNFLFILPLYIKYAHHQINEHSFSIAFNTISFDIDYTFSEFGCI